MTNGSAKKQTFFNPPAIQAQRSPSITPLHDYILACNNINGLNRFIAKHGVAEVKKMACTTDEQGQIPLDIFKKRVKNNTDQDKVKEKLIELSIPSSMSYIRLNSPFRINDYLFHYRKKKDETLNKMLAIACDIGNIVRDVIKKSSTHPDANSYSNKEKKELDKRLKEDAFESLIAIDPVTWEKSIEHKHQTREANDNGCCKLALCYLQDRYPYTNAQLLKLTKSPRTFLVIEPQRGDDALILDIWEGQICLYSERFEFLKNCYRIPTNCGFMNTLTTINPEYEQFELANKVQEQIKEVIYYLMIITFFISMGYRLVSELTNSTADYCLDPELIEPPLYQM